MCEEPSSLSGDGDGDQSYSERFWSTISDGALYNQLFRALLENRKKETSREEVSEDESRHRQWVLRIDRSFKFSRFFHKHLWTRLAQPLPVTEGELGELARMFFVGIDSKVTAKHLVQRFLDEVEILIQDPDSDSIDAGIWGEPARSHIDPAFTVGDDEDSLTPFDGCHLELWSSASGYTVYLTSSKTLVPFQASVDLIGERLTPTVQHNCVWYLHAECSRAAIKEWADNLRPIISLAMENLRYIAPRIASYETFDRDISLEEIAWEDDNFGTRALTFDDLQQRERSFVAAPTSQRATDIAWLPSISILESERAKRFISTLVNGSAFPHAKSKKPDLIGSISLAVESLRQADQQSLDSLRLALSFAAIEALVGTKSDEGVVNQLSRNVAALLITDGEEREAAMRSIRDLYKYRCNAVHGTSLDASRAKALDVRTLAAAVLVASVEWYNRRQEQNEPATREQFLQDLGKAEKSGTSLEYLGVPTDLQWCIPLADGSRKRATPTSNR